MNIKINNRTKLINRRLNLVFRVVWALNDQEVSYLDKHFMLIRRVDDLLKYHIDNHQLSSTLINGRIVYDVVMQGIEKWSELSPDDKICTSWRYNAYNRLAVVIVRPYTGKEEVEE